MSQVMTRTIREKPEGEKLVQKLRCMCVCVWGWAALHWWGDGDEPWPGTSAQIYGLTYLAQAFYLGSNSFYPHLPSPHILSQR